MKAEIKQAHWLTGQSGHRHAKRGQCYWFSGEYHATITPCISKVGEQEAAMIMLL